jgi:hypothetical protein
MKIIGNSVEKEQRYRKKPCPVCDGSGIVGVRQVMDYHREYNMNKELLNNFKDPNTGDWKDEHYDICPACCGDGWIEEVI